MMRLKIILGFALCTLALPLILARAVALGLVAGAGAARIHVVANVRCRTRDYVNALRWLGGKYKELP